MNAEAELTGFLERFEPAVAAVALEAVATLRERSPTTSVLVYDNYNAPAIGFTPSEQASEALFLEHGVSALSRVCSSSRAATN